MMKGTKIRREVELEELVETGNSLGGNEKKDEERRTRILGQVLSTKRMTRGKVKGR